MFRAADFVDASSSDDEAEVRILKSLSFSQALEVGSLPFAQQFTCVGPAELAVCVAARVQPLISCAGQIGGYTVSKNGLGKADWDIQCSMICE